MVWSTRRQPSRLGAPTRQHGFSLVELITVMVVVGALAAIAIPFFAAQQRSAYDSRAVSDAHQMTVTATGLTSRYGSPDAVRPARATRAVNLSTVIWQTGDNPAMVDDFSQSGGVVTRLHADGPLWCVLSWHPRGHLSEPLHSAWASSDTAGVQTSDSPLTSSACRLLIEIEEISPEPNTPGLGSACGLPCNLCQPGVNAVNCRDCGDDCTIGTGCGIPCSECQPGVNADNCRNCGTPCAAVSRRPRAPDRVARP